MYLLMMRLLLFLAVLRFLLVWKSPQMFQWLLSKKRYRLGKIEETLIRTDIIVYSFHSTEHEENCESNIKSEPADTSATTTTTAGAVWRDVSNGSLSHRIIEGRPLYIWDMIVANTPGCISRYLALRRLSAPTSPGRYGNNRRHHGRWVGPSPLRNDLTASLVQESSSESDGSNSDTSSASGLTSNSECSSVSPTIDSSESEHHHPESTDQWDPELTTANQHCKKKE
ncbi:hypothetical protein TRVA0_009S00892 [Trichomonascus vanleenenianus]|uniref:uncharacterized protein n=1 Tax=Trichomonascus vanleenenianus TaxID=2268995 RepID=UPI003ECA6284